MKVISNGIMFIRVMTDWYLVTLITLFMVCLKMVLKETLGLRLKFQRVKKDGWSG